jgi:hypothetical protein
MWNNKLKSLITDTLEAKTVVPSEALLKKAHCSRVRWKRLLNNEVQMNALEVIVFSEWLAVEPKEMIESAQTTHATSFA